MAQKVYEQLINSTDAAGSAVFYCKDYSRFTIALAAVGGTNPVAAYTVDLYLTPDTPDSLAFTYKTASAAAVSVFENIADSDGLPYQFYKVKISYSGLTNTEASGATFTAGIAGY